MIYIVAIIAAILFCCAILYIWRNKYISDVNAIGEASLSAIHKFEELCLPTRCFSDHDVKCFINDHLELKTNVSKYIDSRRSKKRIIEEFSFKKFLDYYDCIYKYQRDNNELYSAICFVNDNLQDLWRAQNALNADCMYQAHHDVDFHKDRCKELIKSINLLTRKGCMIYLCNPSLAREFIIGYNSIIKEDNIKRHNDRFVEDTKKMNKKFFDCCLKYPLDDQQRDAILHLEDNNLVIASAGSGKTSTMVGKAKYMVEVEKIAPEKILIITYTRKAAAELSERLGIEGLSCSTFHALAVKIIGEVTKHKPTICEPDFMHNCFYNLLQSDEHFKDAINQYILEMRSLMKLEHDYVTAEEYYADRKKYGIQAMFKDMHGNIIFTKSEEERRICEWLSIHDIPFTYEEEYEYVTSTDKYKQYRPDFSIYYINEYGETERLYLEHFAINKEGKVPLWFGTDYNNSLQDDENVVRRWEDANRTYNEGIAWKSQLHRSKKTKLISTTSAMFHDNTVWKKLESQLKSYGVFVNELSPEELFNRLVERDKGLERSIFKLIEQFTTLQKSNLIKLDDLINSAKEQKDSRSEFIISNIMNPFIAFYSSELKKKGYIDFTDAILDASALCNQGKWVDYEYILVDEFQDISKDRYIFLNSLRKSNIDCFTKLFCVGDDWQSIYRFSGSDMTLFYDFEKFFGFTKHCKIETTYRFHNPLIDISSKFIQSNPNQVEKSIHDFFVKSEEYLELERHYQLHIDNLPSIYDDLESYYDGTFDEKNKLQFDIANSVGEALESMKPRTQIEFHEYESDIDEKNKVETIIRNIPSNEDVLIIGRYNYDAKSLGFKFTPQDADKKTIWLTLANRRVRFMSVHGSKGLEADHVLLINCNRGINGFPSLIEDDPILTFVLSDKDQFENAEERRVFYVAITRARKNMHVFYNERTPSCFVDEIIGMEEHTNINSAYIPCPTCGQGHIIPIKEGTNAYYGDWIALSCTNKAGGCPYFSLKGKSEYIRMVDDFKMRDEISPVQETSKAMSANIKELMKNVFLKRQIKSVQAPSKGKYNL